jgi:hypothetical protein
MMPEPRRLKEIGDGIEKLVSFQTAKNRESLKPYRDNISMVIN